MAKKEDDFSYGGFDFDKNLDMNFDGEDLQEPAELTTRKVVTDLGKGLAKGTGKSLIDGSRWKAAIRDQLPDSFKTTWNTYDEVTGSLGELYDHAEKEVSPVLGQIAKNVDNLVPEKYTRIKSMTKALSDKFYTAPSSSNSAESIQSEAAGRMIEETFKNLEELTGDSKQLEEKKSLGKEAIDAQIDKNRHEQSIKLFSRMDSNLNRLAIYNERINVGFQKKSLELSFRSYMVLGETLQTLKTNQAETTNLLKVIAHHTKLPEVAKITMTERFKETMKRRSTEGLHNKLFGVDSAFGGAIKRFSGDVKQGIGTFKSGLESGLMGVEAVGDVNDILKTTGTSKVEAAADFGGSFIGDWFRKKIVNKVMPEFLKNDKFQKFGYDAGKAALDPAAGIDALRNTERYKKVKDSKHGEKIDTVVDYFKSLFRQQRGSTELQDTEKINDVRGILDPDNLNKRSAIIQTDAIPGYLARILKQITWLRTNNEPELLKFNPLSGKFLDRKEMKSAAEEILQKESSSGYYGTSVTELSKKLKEEMGFKDEDLGDLTESMSDFTFQHEGALSGEAVKKSKAYIEGNENQKKLLDAVAERIDSNTKDGSETGFNLLKNMKEVRDSSSSMGGIIQSLIDAGFKDQLLELKLIKTNSNGALWLDHEAINKFNFSNLKLQKTKKQLEEEAKNKSVFDAIKERSKNKSDIPTADAATINDGSPAARPSPIPPMPGTPAGGAPLGGTPQSTADAAIVPDPPAPPSPIPIVLPTTPVAGPPPSTADAATIRDPESTADPAPELAPDIIPAEEPKTTSRKPIKRRKGSIDPKTTRRRSAKVPDTPPIAETPSAEPSPKIETDGTTGASEDGTGTSDYNAKKNFQSFSSKKALKSVKNLPVTTWNYKDKKKNKVNGDNRKIGPMAQDVYRELGQEVAPDGKKIDLVSMNGLALSAIQELSKNQEALKSALETGFKKPDDSSQWKSVDYLKSIDEQFFELNETLKNKKLEFIIPGLDFTGVDFSKINVGEAVGAGIEGAKKFVDPLLKTGNKYFDLFQSLLMTGVSDGFELGKKGVKKVAEKAGEASEFAKETWTNNKDAFKEKRQWFYGKVMDISGKAIDLGTDLVKNKIPDAFKSVTQGLKNVRDGIKNILNGPVDVYITGNTSPVLLASRMRAGVYARSSDGKVIKTIDDLLEVKSDIIDLSKNKEVALLWTDIANGLFDAEGKKLKSLTKLATTVALGVAGYGIKKVGEAISYLKDNVPSFDKTKKAFSGIKSMVFDKFNGMSGIGFGDSRMISVLAQIRDLLAVDKPKKILQHVYKRKLEDSKDISGSSFLSILFKNKFIVKDFGFSAKENPLAELSTALTVIPNASGAGQTKQASPSKGGIFKKMVDAFKGPSTLKTILNGKGTPGSDSFVGPVQPGQEKQTVLQKIKTHLSKLPGAGVLKGLKDAYVKGANAPDAQEDKKLSFKDSLYQKGKSFFSKMKDKIFKKTKPITPVASSNLTVLDSKDSYLNNTQTHYPTYNPLMLGYNNKQLTVQDPRDVRGVYPSQKTLGNNQFRLEGPKAIKNNNVEDIEDVEYRTVPTQTKKKSLIKNLLQKGKDKFLDLKESLKDKLPKLKENFLFGKDKLKTKFDKIKNSFNQTTEKPNENIQDVQDVTYREKSNEVTKPSLIKKLIQKGKDKLPVVFNSVKDKFNSGKDLVTAKVKDLNEKYQKAKPEIEHAKETFKKEGSLFASKTKNKVVELAKATKSGLVTGKDWALPKLKTGKDALIKALPTTEEAKETLSKVVNKVKTLKDKVIKDSKPLVTKTKEKLSTVGEKIKTGMSQLDKVPISALIKGVKDAFVKAITEPGDEKKSIKETLKQKSKTFISKVKDRINKQSPLKADVVDKDVSNNDDIQDVAYRDIPNKTNKPSLIKKLIQKGKDKLPVISKKANQIKSGLSTAKNSLVSKLKNKFSNKKQITTNPTPAIYPSQPALGNNQLRLEGPTSSNDDIQDVAYRDIPQVEKKVPFYKRILNRNKVTDFTKQPQTTDPVKKTWKQKLGGLKGKIGGKIGRMGGLKGIIGGAMGFLGKGLSSVLGNKTERPQEDAPVGTALTTIHDRASTVKSIGDGSAGKSSFNDKTGSGERDGGSTEQLRRLEDEDKARKEANATKAAEAAKTSQALALRYVPRENAIDSILNSTKGLISGLTSGISDLFSMGRGLFTKLGGLGKMFKGMGGIGSKVMTGVKAIGTFATSAKVVGAARTALTVARVAGIALGGGVGSLLGLAGTVLTAGLAIVTSPIGLAVLGTAAVLYAGYKAYKYFTRNSLNDYEKVRALQYGLNSESKDLHRIMELEGYFLDGKISYQNGIANFNSRMIKAEEINSIMGIEKDDKKGAEKLVTWLNDRFKRFFLNHVTILFGINPKAKLSAVDDLPAEDLVKYLEATKFLDGPYDVSDSPFKSQESLVNTKADVEKCVDALIAKVKSKDKRKLPRTLADTVIKDNETTKKADDKSTNPGETGQLEEAKKKQAAEKALAPPKPTMSGTAGVTTGKPNDKQIDPNLKGDDGGVGYAELAAKQIPKDTSGTFASAGNVASLNAAAGPLFPEADGVPFLQMYKGAKIDGVKPEVKRNLLGMAAEYGKTTGKNIILTDGSRTYDEQKALYTKSPEKAAKPGTSLHEFGLAIDMDSKVADSLDKLGLMRKYGFTRPVGGEKWHTEPAGIQSNITKAKNDPSFAAEAVEASVGRGGGGFGSQDGSKLKGRNPVMAKALFTSASDKPVEPTKQKEAANDSTLPGVKVAANDPKVDDAPKKVANYLAMPTKKSSTNTAAPVDSSAPKAPANSAGPLTAKASSASVPEASLNESETPPKVFVAKAQNLSVGPAELGGHTGSSSVNDVSKVAANDSKMGTGPKSIPEVKEIIIKAAKQASQDPSMLQLFAAAESGMGQNMKPHKGSAQGPFQFMPATWNEQINKNGKKYDLPATTSPLDIRASTLMASEYLKQNASYIKGKRPNPDIVDYYLTHLLGAGGARTFVNLKDDEVGATKLPAAASYNQAIFYKNGKALTAGEIRQLLYDKFNKLSKQYGVNMAITPANVGGNGDANKQDSNKPGSSEQSKGKPSFAEASPVAKNSPASPGETTKVNTTPPPAKPQVMGSGISDTGNQVEARRGPDRSVKGMPDVANGMSSILERSASAGEQLLTTVQQDIVPILRGVHETLMKIYSEGKEMKSQGSPEKSAPEASQRRSTSTVASSKSTVDRERKYG